jgi:hypothetical protein
MVTCESVLQKLGNLIDDELNPRLRASPASHHSHCARKRQFRRRATFDTTHATLLTHNVSEKLQENNSLLLSFYENQPSQMKAAKEILKQQGS